MSAPTAVILVEGPSVERAIQRLARMRGVDLAAAGVDLVQLGGVTKLGRAFTARVAASLLHAVGLPELVTETDEAYEALALALATDPARLAAIRAKLAANRSTAPLFDTRRYTRDIEALFESIAAQKR